MIYRLNRKRLHSLQSDLCIFTLILMATLLRVVLIYFNWPTTNSDEGNMGILARHVAYNGEVPFFSMVILIWDPLRAILLLHCFMSLVLRHSRYDLAFCHSSRFFLSACTI